MMSTKSKEEKMSSSIKNKAKYPLVFQMSTAKRVVLLISWIITVLFIVFLSLLVGLQLLGPDVGSDLIIGNIYTLTPAIIVIIFVLAFKTELIENVWKNFEFPGKIWFLFGFGYTFLVLSLTLITGFLLGELSINTTYTPLTTETGLTGLRTNIPIIDIGLYIIVIGVLLIFSPGGLIRVIGEEVGWRGYLLPEFLKLRPKISIIVTSFLVGFVWFIYHLPYFTILAPVSADHLLFFVLGSAGVFFGANWAMMWAYLKTKSIWPAIILHFSWNLITPLFTGNIYSKTTGFLNPSLDNIWLVNGEGLIGGFFHAIVGFAFLILILRNQEFLLSNYDNIQEKAMNESDTKLKRMKVVTKSKSRK